MSPLLLFCVSFVLSLGEGGAADIRWVRRDVPAGKPLNLQAFGGSDMDIIVFNREVSSVGTRIVDRTRMVSRDVTDIYGVTQIVDVPFSATRIIPKKNGVPVDGRLSEAYLIFDHPESGLKVFFYDTLDTKQNEFALLVVPGEIKATPESATAAISSLSDPRKLALLSVEDRAISPRFQKIVYWLAVAESQGIAPADALSEAFRMNGTDAVRGIIAIEMIIATYKRAKQETWLTPENLELMRHGRSGIVPFGRYRGQKIEVDHIVPISLYPQLGNELANLQLLPSSENESKGTSMTQASVRLLSRLRISPPLTLTESHAGIPLPDAGLTPMPPAFAPPEPLQPQINEPATPPGWSVIGETLLYKGKPLTDQLSREAASLGVDRELYIQERVWAEKQRVLGANQGDEYELLKQHRLRKRTAREKTAVEQLRAKVLH